MHVQVLDGRPQHLLFPLDPRYWMRTSFEKIESHATLAAHRDQLRRKLLSEPPSSTSSAYPASSASSTNGTAAAVANLQTSLSTRALLLACYASLLAFSLDVCPYEAHRQATMFSKSC